MRMFVTSHYYGLWYTEAKAEEYFLKLKVPVLKHETTTEESSPSNEVGGD